MADETTAAAAAGTTNYTDPFNYEAYQKRLGEISGRVGEVAGGEKMEVNYENPYSEVKTQLGQEAQISYNAQLEAAKAEAANRADALGLMGDATMASMRRLGDIEKQAGQMYQSAVEAWDAIPKAADEAVQRTYEQGRIALAKLDEINQQIGKDRDFAKAHAMQVSSQAVLESMKAQERNILETYGAGSKEYEQFRASKQTSLAIAHSNVHTNYQQFAEQQGLTYLNVVNESMWKHDMYASFQEQQALEMKKFRADARFSYGMQFSELRFGAERMRMNEMGALADMAMNMPVAFADKAPTLTLLAELSEREIIGTEPIFETQTVGGRPSIRGGQSGDYTIGSYQDKPVYG